MTRMKTRDYVLTEQKNEPVMPFFRHSEFTPEMATDGTPNLACDTTEQNT